MDGIAAYLPAVRVCVCVESNNEVRCGELMKFCARGSLRRCQVTSAGKTKEDERVAKLK